MELVDGLRPFARRARNLVATDRPQDDPLFRWSTALALDRVAVLAAEPGKEVVDAAVPVIVPMELETHARRQARLAQLTRLGFRREQDLQRGNRFAAAQRACTFDDSPNGFATVLAGRHQDASSRAGRERHRHAQFRVVR